MCSLFMSCKHLFSFLSFHFLSTKFDRSKNVEHIHFRIQNLSFLQILFFGELNLFADYLAKNETENQINLLETEYFYIFDKFNKKPILSRREKRKKCNNATKFPDINCYSKIVCYYR